MTEHVEFAEKANWSLYLYWALVGDLSWAGCSRRLRVSGQFMASMNCNLQLNTNWETRGALPVIPSSVSDDIRRCRKLVMLGRQKIKVFTFFMLHDSKQTTRNSP